jgi:hypothetical protein
MTESYPTAAEILDGPDYGPDDMRRGDIVRIIEPNGHELIGTVIEGVQDRRVPTVGAFGCRFEVRPDYKILLVNRAAPLPDRPGTVGVATVRGRRIRVMLCQSASGKRVWACSSPIEGDPTALVLVDGDEIHEFTRYDVTPRDETDGTNAVE